MFLVIKSFQAICSFSNSFSNSLLNLLTIKNLIALANYYNVSLDYLCERQFNNQIGYIPEDRREGIIKILKLNDKNFDRTIAYVTALNDVED